MYYVIVWAVCGSLFRTMFVGVYEDADEAYQASLGKMVKLGARFPHINAWCKVVVSDCPYKDNGEPEPLHWRNHVSDTRERIRQTLQLAE